MNKKTKVIGDETFKNCVFFFFLNPVYNLNLSKNLIISSYRFVNYVWSQTQRETNEVNKVEIINFITNFRVCLL